MVKKKYGYEFVDQFFNKNDLPSGGIYTAIGTYGYGEMMTLFRHMSQWTSTPIPALMRTYGRYMFGTFTRSYYPLIKHSTTAFSLLTFIHHYIHVEMQKRYPDAELPHFTVEHPTENHLWMRYEAERNRADFAHGIVEGCLAHYGETATIEKPTLPKTEPSSCLIS